MKHWLKNVISVTLRSDSTDQPWGTFPALLSILKISGLDLHLVSREMQAHYMPIDPETQQPNDVPGNWKHGKLRLIGNDAVKLMQHIPQVGFLHL